MKKTTKLLALTLSAALLLGLTGCGSKEEPAPSAQTDAESSTNTSQAASSDEEKEPVTLRFMWWGADDRAAATIEVIDAFEAKYPWITIEPEYGSSDGYQEKLTTQLASGNGADIIQMGTGWLLGYIKANPDYFIDFNEYADRIDLSTFAPAFLEQNGMIDGKQYGIPTGISSYSLIYNKTLSDATSIAFAESKDESTWDLLLEMGKQLEGTGKYVLSASENEIATCIVRPYMIQLTGKPMVDDKAMALSFTEEQLVQCLTMLKDMYDNNVLPPLADIAAYSTGDALSTDPKWIAGDTYLGMFLASSIATVAAAACPDSDFEAGYMPVMEGAKNDGFYANSPQYMCIPSNSEHIEEAVMFLDYFYNDKEAAAMLKTVRSVPPNSVGQEVCAELGLLEGIAKETVDIVQENYAGVNEMGLTAEEEFTQIMKDMIAQIAYGQGTPEEIAGNTMTLMENYVESRK